MAVNRAVSSHLQCHGADSPIWQIGGKRLHCKPILGTWLSQKTGLVGDFSALSVLYKTIR